MAITGAAVAYSAVGGLVLYSGIKGATLADTAKAVLAGNLTVTGSQPIDFSPGNITSSGGGGSPGTPGNAGQLNSAVPQTGGGPAPAGVAQAYAKSRLAAFGWNDATDWSDLVKLWNQESGWNDNAVNPTSGAYGIPQSLGHGHPYNLGDYKAQIDWGLNYIKGRYGSPAMAWAHEVANNWY